jgi:hypothetical protein
VYLEVTKFWISADFILLSGGENSTWVLLNLISHKTFADELKKLERSFDNLASITLQLTKYSCLIGISFIFFLMSRL